MSCYDTIIIGSGPAGLAAAAAAAASGKRTLIIEQLPKPGCKLLASGGGKCNVSNTLPPGEMARAFGKAERFVRHALYTFPATRLVEYFTSRGVPLKLSGNFHYFPESERAADILNALLDDSRSNGAELVSSCRIDRLVFANKKLCGVSGGGRTFHAPQVIIACGGNSWPKLGGNGGGYQLARQAGHRITALFPAMTGVQTLEAWPGECAGISLDDAETRIDLPGEKERCRGELLFTRNGISAFAILDISGRISELLQYGKPVPLKINLFPEISEVMWQERFALWQKQYGNQSVGRQLAGLMPRRLAEKLCPAFQTKCASFTASARKELISKLTALPLQITATEGWDKAMVTRGGAALEEVDPRTLESRLCPGLFFAGEVLDVDGPCGGYNISWALASGFCAGAKMAGDA